MPSLLRIRIQGNIFTLVAKYMCSECSNKKREKSWVHGNGVYTHCAHQHTPFTTLHNFSPAHLHTSISQLHTHLHAHGRTHGPMLIAHFPKLCGTRPRVFLSQQAVFLARDPSIDPRLMRRFYRSSEYRGGGLGSASILCQPFSIQPPFLPTESGPPQGRQERS